MNDVVHTPVLLNEVLEHLNPQDGEVYVDCTFGAGGYSRAILNAANCKLIAFDRDADAVARADTFQKEFGERFQIIHAPFSELKSRLVDQVDGIVADLGVSSPQIDTAERGFSFLRDGPLDMRMDAGQGQTAADLVNTADEKDLQHIIATYGEERYARSIVRAILKHRPFETTRQLASVIEGAVPPAYRHGPIHAATRSFQALRIAVNQELTELETLLVDSPQLIKKNGRLVIVSFHSLEDSLVKSMLHRFAVPPSQPSRHVPIVKTMSFEPLFTLTTKKPVSAGETETDQNPRARSARLRAAIRTEVSV